MLAGPYVARAPDRSSEVVMRPVEPHDIGGDDADLLDDVGYGTLEFSDWPSWPSQLGRGRDSHVGDEEHAVVAPRA